MDVENQHHEWFEEWFDEDYLELYRHRDAHEAELLVHWLKQKLGNGLDGKLALDLACGAGRHTKCLASSLNCGVVGVDLSLTMIHQAVVNTKDCLEQGPSPTFVRGDIRRLPFGNNTFSFILNAFTSFGYFQSDEEHQLVLSEVRRTLIPNGWFLIDLANPVETLNSLVEEDSIEREHFIARQVRTYDSDRHRLTKTIQLHLKSGKIREITESVRLFQKEELLSMMSASGLNPVDLIGNYGGGKFLPESSKRMIFLCRRTG